ncbi:hypothetical protein [Clostridium arbusti]|uniref:hypothetical protein n=1 Tax=Clostridium arbusti TaxID=1137848 RepID=UPI0002884839|nr:hypothetical protein [Clostridium arbusti]
MSEVIKQNTSNKFVVISCILAVLLVMCGGLLHMIFRSAIVVVPAITIAFSILGIIKSNKSHLEIGAIVSIIIGIIYVALYIH